MISKCGERYGDLSYMLGGRSSLRRPDGLNPDGAAEKWKPKLSVVKAVVRFALSTGRLGPQSESKALMYNSQQFGA